MQTGAIGGALFALMALAAPALAEQSPLAAYVGKYPTLDKVGGVVFLDQPSVVAGVKKAVTDKTVLGWVLNKDVTEAPVAQIKGQLVAHACEPHNCGDHDWAIVVTPASGAIDVCYHDASAMKDTQSRWYLAAGGNQLRDGDCPSG